MYFLSFAALRCRQLAISVSFMPKLSGKVHRLLLLTLKEILLQGETLSVKKLSFRLLLTVFFLGNRLKCRHFLVGHC